MRLEDKVAVVTGAAAGIGRALCRRFAQEGARIVAVDRSQAVEEVARDVHGTPVVADVADDAAIERLVRDTVRDAGRIDLFCSNAGISIGGGLDATTDADWQRMWQVNVLSHIYAARHVVPVMIEAGGGYLLQTASAAGLVTQVGSAPYSVTKHAAVAFAEWLAITYADRGIKVSCLCPLGVRTDMLARAPKAVHAILDETALDPETVADAVVAGLADERFLILPHPEVLEYFRRKGSDYDRWLRGMARLKARTSSDVSP